ncbi:hypothetical protein [Limnoraphis robusta]|uniref:Uncharacterized protein n=1 Tax=Limnoraphis robusta CCNP1315 TaxID=3110306 RepID=A0ABU5U824_9CYAN|nr:hypothetical protein [Limnoraphis robusta]MEA5523324.1 hypothetical protein [Limnoraphis robusta CCNP1315]MEA5547622.1 hypothetical protein [Limnoraphis robusta CCNP1324]
MKEKCFWHRLVAVMTLTLVLVTVQFHIPYNPAFAVQNVTCYSDKMSHTDCTINNTTNNTTNNTINNTQREFILIHDDSGKAEAFLGGVIVGAIGGSAATIATVSSAGSVAGLSAAGITSGLATIGRIAGGGMVAGLAVSASVPVVTAATVGYGAYKAWEWFNHPSQQLVGINH